MKRFAIIILTLIWLSAPSYAREYRVKDIPNVQLADRTKFVSNPDGLLSGQAVYRIDTMLYSLKETGRAQVVVIAVNSIGGEDPFSFLHELLTQWGVGRRDTDDGLGILLVVDQGAIEIQTGYGLEGDLPDALLKRIIDRYMLPAFRERDWDRGMIQGVTAINEVLAGRMPSELADEEKGSDIVLIIALLVFFGFPLAVGIVAAYFKNRCPRCHKRTLKRVGTQTLSKTRHSRVEEVTYVCSNCGHVVKRRHTHNNGGGMIIGGGIGGGMMGGFGGGGFGGGGFGGGGARGSF